MGVFFTIYSVYLFNVTNMEKVGVFWVGGWLEWRKCKFFGGIVIFVSYLLFSWNLSVFLNWGMCIGWGWRVSGKDKVRIILIYKFSVVVVVGTVGFVENLFQRAFLCGFCCFFLCFLTKNLIFLILPVFSGGKTGSWFCWLVLDIPAVIMIQDRINECILVRNR